MGTRRPVLCGFREVIFPGAPPRGPASSSEAREGPRAGTGGLRLPRDRTQDNGIRWWVRLAAGRVEHLAICGAPGAIGRNPGSGTCPGTGPPGEGARNRKKKEPPNRGGPSKDHAQRETRRGRMSRRKRDLRHSFQFACPALSGRVLGFERASPSPVVVSQERLRWRLCD